MLPYPLPLTTNADRCIKTDDYENLVPFKPFQFTWLPTVSNLNLKFNVKGTRHG